MMIKDVKLLQDWNNNNSNNKKKKHTWKKYPKAPQTIHKPGKIYCTGTTRGKKV